MNTVELHHAKWYANIRTYIVEHCGEDADLFCDILAATSPRQAVKKNWRIAQRIYNQFCLCEPIDVGDLPRSIVPNVYRALSGAKLSGPKVTRFAENLKGNLNVVTIDTWICKYYGITKLVNGDYELLEQRIIREAAEHNLKPAEYQAVIWQRARQAAGFSVKSYMMAIDESRQMSLGF